jgi:uncharacterized protein YkwD
MLRFSSPGTGEADSRSERVRVVDERRGAGTLTRFRASRGLDLSRPGRGRTARRTALPFAAALLLAACSTGSLQPVTPIAVDAGRTASLVSAYRAQNGLGPVRVESRLMQAAAAQARRNGAAGKLSHRAGGSLPRRVSEAGYDWGATAENLGAGYGSLDAAMAGWKSSPGHRKNLLNPLVTEIGVAAVAAPPKSRYRTYWALILATPRPEPPPGGPFGTTAVRFGPLQIGGGQ